MSDSLDNVQIADPDGKGIDDILRSVDGTWQVSVGGRTAWQPLVSSNGLSCCFFGHYDGSKGAQMLALTWPEEVQFIPPTSAIRSSPFFPLASDDYRRSLIFSRANGGFAPYGKYSY
jgi:hypothetical protein